MWRIWTKTSKISFFVFLILTLMYFFHVHVGERHHERHHVQPTADQQWEDLIELGSPVHCFISRSQCAEFHHQLGRWPGSQRHPAPLQVRKWPYVLTVQSTTSGHTAKTFFCANLTKTVLPSFDLCLSLHLVLWSLKMLTDVVCFSTCRCEMYFGLQSVLLRLIHDL